MSINHVLVTGATGFLGAHVVDELLARGLRVRAAVRNLAKANAMRDARPQYASKLEFVQVADFTANISFEEAVKDIDGIIHVASPLTFGVEDNERDFLLPAINGVTSVLKAAAQAPQIRRVVITSSFASVIDVDRKAPPHFTYTAADWNPLTYEVAADNNTSEVVAYRGSKKFAELAAWDFVHKEKPGFDIVTLCPPLAELNDSAAKLWEVASGVDPMPLARVPFWIDVRDLAQAHVESLLRPEVGNKRFTIASPERFSYQKAAEIIIKEFDWGHDRVHLPDTEQTIDQSHDLDGETAARELGITYRSFHDSVVDFVSQAQRLEASQKG
ncbi:putative oxidoreductase [Cladophialophora carrionii]|uniref:Putative oxidoreductase n=1 Tax=Cladophialophora carrionii TaxID=86049 RepID=A0A1C1CSB7_9EURO|nr:putative oxidoreductase [Cladophialophora carrionii]